MTFCVSDEEKVRAGKAIAWLDSEIRKLLDKSSESLGKP
jgi:predicted DNA-binding transcriptional regulator AlpA